MGISILVFVLPLLITHWQEPFFDYGALNGYMVLIKGDTYRLLTSLFLHADMMHVAMNMLSLYIVGTMVERLFSSASYLGIYFLSALFGSFVSIYMHPMGWAVGASGAIFGLFGALAGFAFVHRKTMKKEFMEFMRSFGMILLLNLVIGLIFPSIDMSAHIGGLLAGIVGGFMVAKNPNYLWLYLLFGTLLLFGFYSYLNTLYVPTQL